VGKRGERVLTLREGGRADQKRKVTKNEGGHLIANREGPRKWLRKETRIKISTPFRGGGLKLKKGTEFRGALDVRKEWKMN